MAVENYAFYVADDGYVLRYRANGYEVWQPGARRWQPTDDFNTATAATRVDRAAARTAIAEQQKRFDARYGKR